MRCDASEDGDRAEVAAFMPRGASDGTPPSDRVFGSQKHGSCWTTVDPECTRFLFSKDSATCGTRPWAQNAKTPTTPDDTYAYEHINDYLGSHSLAILEIRHAQTPSTPSVCCASIEQRKMPGLTKEEQAEAEALAISAPMDSMEDPVSTIKLLEEIVARPVDTADAEGITQQEQARYGWG